MKSIIRDEKGTMMLITMLTLFALTTIGLMSLTNTEVEMQISKNDRLAKMAFFTAESARGFVAGHPVLYNDSIMVDADGIEFPKDFTNDEGTGADEAEYEAIFDAGKIWQADIDEDGELDIFYCLDAPDPNNPDEIPCQQKIRGTVEYVQNEDAGDRTPPRGSGFSVGDYSAYVYKMECEGYFDPLNSLSSTNKFLPTKKVEQGFFRIGL